jgi:hypothetical protein
VVKGDWQMPFAPTRIPGETGSGENRRKPVRIGRGQNRLVLQLKPEKSDKLGRAHLSKARHPGSHVSLAHAREVPQKASFKRLP